MKTVLFLCSGNYYRSRFAESLFNAHAAKMDLPWRAESRGFRLSPGNVGPISAHALDGLKRRGIDCESATRFPLVVTERDLETAHLVVAMKEAEHRPQMETRFPAWTNRIEYWRIDDVDCAQPEAALAHLDAAVMQLIERLDDPGGRQACNRG